MAVCISECYRVHKEEEGKIYLGSATLSQVSCSHFMCTCIPTYVCMYGMYVRTCRSLLVTCMIRYFSLIAGLSYTDTLLIRTYVRTCLSYFLLIRTCILLTDTRIPY